MAKGYHRGVHPPTAPVNPGAAGRLDRPESRAYAGPVRYGMVCAASALFLALGLWSQESPVPTDPAPRYAQVTLRLLTVGEKQPLKEVGSFGASLPLGRPGRLERMLSIANETRGTQISVPLRLVLTPSLDEAGVLHCVAVSEVTAPDGAPDSRAKDLLFTHPGDQLMEVFADPATRVRVVLSVSARLVEEPRQTSVWPLVQFGVRVEQWMGAQRDEIEALQLQSLEGRAVSHDYTRRVPRWVEGREGDLVLDDLPVLDLKQEKPTVQAGQGFVIPLTEPEAGEGQGAETQPKKRDSRVPPPAPKAPRGPDTPRSIVWDEEYYRLTVVPLQLSKNGMRLRVVMEGRLFDPVTGKLDEKMEQTLEKEVLPGEPFPAYLTRETEGGPRGFVVWILPAWEAGTR